MIPCRQLPAASRAKQLLESRCRWQPRRRQRRPKLRAFRDELRAESFQTTNHTRRKLFHQLLWDHDSERRQRQIELRDVVLKSTKTRRASGAEFELILCAGCRATAR